MTLTFGEAGAAVAELLAEYGESCLLQRETTARSASGGRIVGWEALGSLGKAIAWKPETRGREQVLGEQLRSFGDWKVAIQLPVATPDPEEPDPPIVQFLPLRAADRLVVGDTVFEIAADSVGAVDDFCVIVDCNKIA